MALSGMRGLSVFISDVRNCQNKEQERLRVDKELGNVRTRFKNEKVRGFCAFLFVFLRVHLYVLLLLSLILNRLRLVAWCFDRLG
jgi:hypothetical protein